MELVLNQCSVAAQINMRNFGSAKNFVGRMPRWSSSGRRGPSPHMVTEGISFDLQLNDKEHA